MPQLGWRIAHSKDKKGKIKELVPAPAKTGNGDSQPNRSGAVSTATQTMCGVVPGVPAAQEAETGRLEARVQKQPQETQSHK